MQVIAGLETARRDVRAGCAARVPEWCVAAVVFGVALLIRAAFNCCWSDHRIVDIGDGYLYLLTGNKLLTAVQHSHSIGAWLANVGNCSGKVLDGLLTSTRLGDRLLLDGPIYPLYLCAVQWLIGVPANTTNFSLFTHGLALSYSFTDSLTCLTIFAIAAKLFDRKTAALAGLLYALYPPAIINTANSFSEPFASFCLSIFVLTLLRLLAPIVESTAAGRARSTSRWAIVGITAGVAMLVRSAFVIMPVLSAAAFLAAAWWRGRVSPAEFVFRLNSRNTVSGLAALLCALAAIVGPYLSYTWWQTGRPSFVSRAPGYNISVGNQLASDGWQWYSPQLMISDSKQALAFVAREVTRHPGQYAALYARKFVRLWGGAWNDFQHFFLASPDWQDVLHEVILISALAGVGSLLRTPALPQGTFCGAVALAAVCWLHCAYVCFLPLSRYAFTAMPEATVLAAFAWTSVWRRAERLRLIAWLFGVLGLCVARRFIPSFLSPLVDGGLPYDWARTIDGAIWVCGWSAVWVAAAFLTGGKRTIASTTFVLIVLCGGIAIMWQTSCGDVTLAERASWLTAGTEVRRSAVIPKLPSNVQAGLLVDSWSASVSPTFEAVVNGKVVDGIWVPWLQTRNDARSEQFVEVLALQSRASGIPMQQMRQWWFMPIPARALIAGRNEVVLRASSEGDAMHGMPPAARNDAGDIIYGDYSDDASEQRLVPSLYDYSHMKGFATHQRGDCRAWTMYAPGGHYRVFLTLRTSQFAASNVEMLPLPVLCKEDAVAVSGSNPLSFLIAEKKNIQMPRPVETESVLAGLSCEIMGNRPHGSCCIYLEWIGLDERGVSRTYCSPWRNEEIPCTNKWTKLVVNDLLPQELMRWHDVSVKVIAVPFHADLLFLQRAEALKRRAAIRKLSIQCWPAPISKNESRWLLY